jgi:hypothetical protein
MAVTLSQLADVGELLGGIAVVASLVLAFRGFRIWWQQSRSVLSASFIDHVDAMIAV